MKRARWNTPDTFWARATPDESGCWVWAGTRNDERGGYGQISYGGKIWRAHRLAYVLARGPIPVGMVVRHTCDNPPCVNPEHLEIGSYAENAADMVTRGRAAIGEKNGLLTHPESRHYGGRNPLRKYPDLVRRGEDAAHAVLTVAQVMEIRSRAAAGESHESIARDMPVQRRQVSRIVNGERWAHIK